MASLLSGAFISFVPKPILQSVLMKAFGIKAVSNIESFYQSEKMSDINADRHKKGNRDKEY